MEKITSITEYQRLAARTCPDLGSFEKNLRHMQLGVITEVGEALDVIKKNVAYGKEMDLVNLGEEIADIIWYKANENRMLGYPKWTDDDFEEAELHVSDYKILFNTEVQWNNLDQWIAGIQPKKYAEESDSPYSLKDVAVLKSVIEFIDLDFYQVLTNNIAKLKVRYPEKFTNEQALNRDTEAERKELEK